jgi:uncharacterized membrane protein
MNTFLRYLQFLALGLWVGAIVYLSFVVAPAVFTTLPDADQAGGVIRIVLSRLHWMGIGAGIVYLLAGVARGRSLGPLGRPGGLAVILMVLLTLVSQQGVFRRIDALRAQMGSYERTPASSPLRQQFDRLHQVSVGIESAVLLLGLAALFFTTREQVR